MMSTSQPSSPAVPTGHAASSSPRTHWKHYVGGVAWPTLGLWAFVGVGCVGMWVLALTEACPLWLAGSVNTVLAYMAFTCMHEAAHGNLHGRSARFAWLNELVGWTSGPLLLAPYPAFKTLHLVHHSQTNDPDKDPDYWVAGKGVVGIGARCFTIIPHYLYDFFIGPTSRTRGAESGRRPALAFFVTQVAVIGALAVAGLGVEVLALWILPALGASGVLAFLFDWLPHVPHREQNRYHDTRAVVLPGLPWVTLGQSYHLVHHLYPRIPFYRYGACFWNIRPELEARGAPIWDWRDRRMVARSGALR